MQSKKMKVIKTDIYSVEIECKNSSNFREHQFCIRDRDGKKMAVLKVYGWTDNSLISGKAYWELSGQGGNQNV